MGDIARRYLRGKTMDEITKLVEESVDSTEAEGKRVFFQMVGDPS